MAAPIGAAARTGLLHRLDEPLVEQPPAGVGEISGGHQAIAYRRHEIADAGAVCCADAEDGGGVRITRAESAPPR